MKFKIKGILIDLFTNVLLFFKNTMRA